MKEITNSDLDDLKYLVPQGSRLMHKMNKGRAGTMIPISVCFHGRGFHSLHPFIDKATIHMMCFLCQVCVNCVYIVLKARFIGLGLGTSQFEPWKAPCKSFIGSPV